MGQSPSPSIGLRGWAGVVRKREKRSRE